MASCALYKKDEFACLNCPYDECIKDLDARKAKNKRIAKDEKYVISLMEKKERNKENGARWRAKIRKKQNILQEKAIEKNEQTKELQKELVMQRLTEKEHLCMKELASTDIFVSKRVNTLNSQLMK